MAISFNIDHENKIIALEIGDTMNDQNIGDYFRELLSRKDELSGMTEIVDLTGVETFVSTYDGFSDVIQIFGELARQRVIVKSIFKVSNSLQYGMSRMFSAQTSRFQEEYGYEIDFEFVDWSPNFPESYYA